MKKITFLIILVLVVVVIGGYSYVSVSKSNLQNNVESHLLQEGYKIEDIKSITPHFGKAPLFSAWVVFVDEPDVVYYYTKRNGQVIQLGSPTDLADRSNTDFQHVEGNR
ncbi:DUF3139 domain-containing protein [Paenibacillus sp. Y412MC10]|uniref:DUF3139 domain-containing protein n=1 Tax=Geobacillus sp. (strain Y412MC10) TaxID=481743 RepID=UPI001642D16B|nr:DUF3139 domain-containing protein [Paenibacillus sp. Y412MC10]